MLKMSVLKLFTEANLHFINLADNTKLPCYTLSLIQHHSFFKSLPFLSIWKITFETGKSFCFSAEAFIDILRVLVSIVSFTSDSYDNFLEEDNYCHPLIAFKKEKVALVTMLLLSSLWKKYVSKPQFEIPKSKHLLMSISYQDFGVVNAFLTFIQDLFSSVLTRLVGDQSHH